MVGSRGKQTSIEFSGELRAKIDDFREANSKMVLATLVREAVEMYIDERLETEQRLKQRYEKVRRERIAGERSNIRLLEGGTNSKPDE